MIWLKFSLIVTYLLTLRDLRFILLGEGLIEFGLLLVSEDSVVGLPLRFDPVLLEAF